MSNLIQNHDQISNSWKNLTIQWSVTSDMWGDDAKGRFEKEFWNDYEPTLTSFLKELERLNQIIDQAQQNVH